MSEIHFNTPGGESGASASSVSGDSSFITPGTMQNIALAIALFASAISLGIAVFAGLHRADTVDEQVWSVATAIVAVICMHLAPLACRFVSSGARFVLGALWLLAAFVVLRGQVDVLELANMHAADKRAQTVAVVAVPTALTGQLGRSLTAITQDIANVTTDLAHVDARRCVGDCPSLRARKAALSTRLVALNAEANEAKRRETEEDWLRDQASRAQELRESRRADPCSALVAQWLGTTEARLNTLLDLACVVVVEGTACFAWYFAGIRRVATARTAVVSDRQTTMPRHEPVAPVPDVMSGSRVEESDGHAADIAVSESVADDATGSSAMTEDDVLVAKIHEAVLAGRVTRNLAAIRKFLRCGQPKATRLYGLYRARFGEVRCQAPQCD